MGTEDAARAETRAAMRGGWALAGQRAHYERMLEAARVRLEAIAAVAAEVEAARSRGTE
jgi:hypothetical protein